MRLPGLSPIYLNTPNRAPRIPWGFFVPERKPIE